MKSPTLIPTRLAVFSSVALLLFACGNDVAAPTEDPSTGGTSSGGGAGTGGDTSTPVGTLVDDFEDGDETTLLGTGWFSYSDAGAKGASTVRGASGNPSFVGRDGRASSHALHVEFTFDQADYEWTPFVGVGFVAAPSPTLTEFEGISYWYRGAAHDVRFQTANVVDFDFFLASQPAATEWTKVVVPFASLRQRGFGASVEWRPDLVTEVSFESGGADGASGELSLDDVWFETTVAVDRGPKNLELLPPDPPEKTVLPSLAIPTALQTKALADLDRGYSLVDWLANERFVDFRYDEAFVERLANAGFRALRLPIDLDLYVDAKTGEGDSTTVTVHEDLWTVLDSFDVWTEAHGLSLTIDYHQYDRSWNFEDAEGVDVAVAVWKAVAAHFAGNPREDLYFELLNEPELLVAATSSLPATSWTPVAERMIAAIRSEDTAHTIVFGDVNWYGIDQLAARTPFADDNIVYAFHAFEPFIFTHQGATWTELGATKNVPFPYSVERWSEYASDFGLTTAQPEWIWSQYRNYHVEGTVEALFNRVAKAKAWAVEHQVPLVCNGFGVYNRSSTLEDRVAYLSALVDVFEELEIPWQHWYMIMNDSGVVASEYRAAFGLDR